MTKHDKQDHRDKHRPSSSHKRAKLLPITALEECPSRPSSSARHRRSSTSPQRSPQRTSPAKKSPSSKKSPPAKKTSSRSKSPPPEPKKGRSPSTRPTSRAPSATYSHHLRSDSGQPQGASPRPAQRLAVSFSPSTRFDQCRQSFNVAMPRDDELIEALMTPPPAPAEPADAAEATSPLTGRLVRSNAFLGKAHAGQPRTSPEKKPSPPPTIESTASTPPSPLVLGDLHFTASPVRSPLSPVEREVLGETLTPRRARQVTVIDGPARDSTTSIPTSSKNSPVVNLFSSGEMSSVASPLHRTADVFCVRGEDGVSAADPNVSSATRREHLAKLVARRRSGGGSSPKRGSRPTSANGEGPRPSSADGPRPSSSSNSDIPSVYGISAVNGGGTVRTSRTVRSSTSSMTSSTSGLGLLLDERLYFVDNSVMNIASAMAAREAALKKQQTPQKAEVETAESEAEVATEQESEVYDPTQFLQDEMEPMAPMPSKTTVAAAAAAGESSNTTAAPVTPAKRSSRSTHSAASAHLGTATAEPHRNIEDSFGFGYGMLNENSVINNSLARLHAIEGANNESRDQAMYVELLRDDSIQAMPRSLSTTARPQPAPRLKSAPPQPLQQQQPPHRMFNSAAASNGGDISTEWSQVTLDPHRARRRPPLIVPTQPEKSATPQRRPTERAFVEFDDDDEVENLFFASDHGRLDVEHGMVFSSPIGKPGKVAALTAKFDNSLSSVQRPGTELSMLEAQFFSTFHYEDDPSRDNSISAPHPHPKSATAPASLRQRLATSSQPQLPALRLTPTTSPKLGPAWPPKVTPMSSSSNLLTSSPHTVQTTTDGLTTRNASMATPLPYPAVLPSLSDPAEPQPPVNWRSSSVASTQRSESRQPRSPNSSLSRVSGRGFPIMADNEGDAWVRGAKSAPATPANGGMHTPQKVHVVSGRESDMVTVYAPVHPSVSLPRGSTLSMHSRSSSSGGPLACSPQLLAPLSSRSPGEVTGFTRLHATSTDTSLSHPPNMSPMKRNSILRARTSGLVAPNLSYSPQEAILVEPRSSPSPGLPARSPSRAAPSMPIS